MKNLRPLLVILLTSCGDKTPPETAATPTELPEYAKAVLADLDTSADPCQDFYQYACGGWLARTELPSDKPVWTRSFSQIAEDNRAFLRDLLERAAEDPSAGDEDWARMGHYYGACMDEEAVEAAGLTGVQPLLDQVDAVTDKSALMPLAAELMLVDVEPFMGVEVEGDFLEPQLTILHMGPSGLGLPDRDYYLKDDPDSVELLKEYTKHIAKMFELSGVSAEDAAAQADAIVLFEKKLAETHPPREDMRDPSKIYHRLDRSGLDEQVSTVDWGAFLAALGAPEAKEINVMSPEALTGAVALIDETELDTLKVYLKWHVLDAFALHLPKAFFDADQAFFGVKVLGRQEAEPRWKRCVRSTDGAMGEIVGRYFVEERFAGDSKDIALAMIHGIEDSFGAGLSGLSWMDDATREVAVQKKDSLSNKIGYPDEWRDYSGLVVTPDNPVANVIAARKHESKRFIDQVGQPHDPNLWYMSPPTVNAYYHPLFNEMVFPAGILQAPFFDKDNPSALNFGAIGSVMGHELSHGFDDAGRQFDPEGKMVPWWSDSAVEAFTAQAQCVEDQFSAFEIEPGLHVNGKLTLGENIADLGGIRTSYRAWKAYATEHGESGASVEGLTDDQLFFLAYAQSWCTVASPEFRKMLVMSDPHSPDRYRVMGPLSNLSEFHEAFQCDVGTPMHPEEPCEVW